MKRLAWILIAALALGAAALCIVLFSVDTEKIRGRLAETASRSLGRQVAIASLDLAFFPPGIRVEGTRVAGARAGSAALAEIPEIRVDLRLLPLLRAEFVVASIVVEHARFKIPEDPGAAGFPASGSGAEDLAAGLPVTALGLAFVADRVQLRDATIELGNARLEGVQAEGSVALDASGGLERAGFVLDGTLRGRRDEIQLRGPLRLELQIPGRFELDLSQAALTSASGTGKAAGTALRILGELDAALPPERISEGSIVLGEARIPFTAEFGAGGLGLRLPPGSIDLALIGPLFSDHGRPLAGRVLHGPIQVARTHEVGWEWFGEGRLDAVEFSLGGAPVVASGRFRFEDLGLRVSPLDLDFGGEPIQARALYAFGSGRFELEAAAQDAEAAGLVAAFSDRLRLEGRLSGKVSLAGNAPGPALFESMSGRGRFRIDDGRIHGLSLLASLEGSLAGVPVLLARLSGRDLSRYEQEEFRRLSAEFVVDQGRVWTNNLILEYRGARAELRGSIGLEDLGLDLAGRAILDVEPGSGAADAGSAGGRVIPIAGVTGTVRRPRVHIAPSTLLALTAEYAAASPLLEKIEEQIGTENVEAVKGLLDRILGGSARDRR